MSARIHSSGDKETGQAQEAEEAEEADTTNNERLLDLLRSMSAKLSGIETAVATANAKVASLEAELQKTREERGKDMQGDQETIEFDKTAVDLATATRECAGYASMEQQLALQSQVLKIDKAVNTKIRDAADDTENLDSDVGKIIIEVIDPLLRTVQELTIRPVAYPSALVCLSTTHKLVVMLTEITQVDDPKRFESETRKEWQSALKELTKANARWAKLSASGVPGSLVQLSRTQLATAVESIPDAEELQKGALLATRFVWGAFKSVVTMSVDEGAIKAAVAAGEMAVNKLRRMHAKKYATKFAAFASFEAKLADESFKAELTSNPEGDDALRDQLSEMWTHLVVNDPRWETRASFGMMVTKVILTLMNTSERTTSKTAEGLALWCLKGEGDDSSYEGLLSLMTHGEPKGAEDRNTETLSLKLSTWLSKLFETEGAGDAGTWLARGVEIFTRVFEEEMHAIVVNAKEAGERKISQVLENTAGSLSAQSEILQSLRVETKQNASRLRNAADTVDGRLVPFLKKARDIVDKVAAVASLDATAAMQGKLEMVEDVMTKQLDSIRVEEGMTLTSLKDLAPLRACSEINLLSIHAHNLVNQLKQWEGALRALTRGFEGKAFELITQLPIASQCDDLPFKNMVLTINACVKVFREAAPSVISKLESWSERMDEHVASVRADLWEARDEAALSTEQERSITHVNDIFIHEFPGAALATVKDLVSEKIKDEIEPALRRGVQYLEKLRQSKIDGHFDENVKAFQRCVRRVLTRIADLQDTLTTATDSVRKAAGVMEQEMDNRLGQALKANEQAIDAISKKKKSVVGSASKAASKIGSYLRGKPKKSDEEKTEADVSALIDPKELKQKLEKTENTVNEHVKTALDSLTQVLALIQLLPISTSSIKFPDLKSVTAGLKVMSETLRGAAMEELESLGTQIKGSVGDSVEDIEHGVEDLGAGGLLSEVGQVLADAVAEKRSKQEQWRVREVSAVCIKMLAADPRIKGGPIADEVHEALIKRRSFETNERVLAVMNAANELPKRLAQLAVEAPIHSAGAEGGAPSTGVDDEEEDGVDGGAPSTTVDDEEEGGHGRARADDSEFEEAQGEYLALHKDQIGSKLSLRMEVLAALEEKARNETDGIKKAVLLVQCRLESNMLVKQVQNSSDLGEKLNVLLDFVDGLKSKLNEMDEKLDQLSLEVGAMHEDVKRLAGRPVLEVYEEWTDRTNKAAGSRLPSEVYIEAEVVGPGAKGRFQPDDKHDQNPEEENKPIPVTEAFREFMESEANVLLLSGAAGSGKSTAYGKLQMYILNEYARKRKADDDYTVVLLPVSLPQLRDPINGIWREGLELAYDRTLRPNHADELREMVQDPEKKIEIVFFLDAYDGVDG